MAGNNYNTALGAQERNPCPRTYNLEGSALSLFWIRFLLRGKEIHRSKKDAPWSLLPLARSAPGPSDPGSHGQMAPSPLLGSAQFTSSGPSSDVPPLGPKDSHLQGLRCSLHLRFGVPHIGVLHTHTRPHAVLDRDRGERERERRQT